MKTVDIKPDYFKDFKCSCDKCVNSCCVGWNVTLDKITYSKYMNMYTDFSAYIKENISDKRIILKKGYCPFLGTDCLCKIQKKYGEEFLSDICRTYPRHKKNLLFLQYNDLLISCPEVIKMLRKHKLFNFEETYIKSKFKEEKNDKCVNELYFLLRDTAKYVYNLKISFKKQMYLMLKFANDSHELLSQIPITNKSVETFKKTYTEEYFKTLLKTFKPNKNINIVEDFQFDCLSELEGHRHTDKKIIGILDNYLNINFDNLNYKKVLKQVIKLSNKAIKLKNLFFYLILYSLTDVFNKDNFLEIIKFVIHFIAYLSEINLASYLSKPIPLFENNFYKITSEMFRIFYHATLYDDYIKMFKTSEKFSYQKVLDYVLASQF